MTDYINVKNTTSEAFHYYQQGYLNGRAEAETKHDKMCETCIHKVSAEDIEQIRADVIEEFADWLVEKEILGNRVIVDGTITTYGKVYAKQFKEWLKEQNK